MSNQFKLLQEKRFRPFFFTQFLGAFNDNVFKTALITLVAFRAGQLTTIDSKTLSTLLPGLFILPFFIFSATAGQIADKFEKSSIARAVKIFEILIMMVASFGFLTNSFWVLVFALFMMGMHSTLFGPVKYAYLPQHLAEDELVGGNGMVEMGTFVAILVGEVLGAWLATSSVGAVGTSIVIMSIALMGYWVSRGIPISPASDPELKLSWNPVTETWNNLIFAKKNRVVWLSLMGISWFWFYGATLLAQFPVYAKAVLHGDESVFILLLSVFSFGIGLGSLLCEKLSGHRVEIGLVPLGAIGLTVFGVDLYFFSIRVIAEPESYDVIRFLSVPLHWRGLLDIILLGLFGGFYIVPLYALIQTRSEKSHQSRVIAANNILNALFMVVSAGLSVALFALGLDIPELFLVTALLNAVVAVYIYSLVPEFLIRFALWIVVRVLYRLKTKNIERIPHQGAALLVANHPSYADIFMISAAHSRPIRFVVPAPFFRSPLLSFLLKDGKAIPLELDPEGAPTVATEERIHHALGSNELVLLFPEVRVSEDGTLAPFPAWLGKIISQNTVPVIPIGLQGLWGSVFSRYYSGVGRRILGLRFFRRVSIHVGEPFCLAEATPAQLHERVRILSTEEC